MKNAKKVLAVILSLIMMLAVVPFVTLADAEPEDNNIADRVDGWQDNYGLLLDYLFDNEAHIAYNYLLANDENLQKQVTMSTVLALHDDAWINAITGEADVEQAEAILLALVERVESDLNTNTVDTISKVLEGVDDAGDAIEKVNEYLNITDAIGGDTWNDVFKYLGYAITAVNMYGNAKADVIEAYARILSAKAADVYFSEYLQYIIDNSTYDVLVAAAQNILVNIQTSVDELLQELNAYLVGDIALQGGEMAANILIDLAINSNVYTAAADKVYSIGVKVADALWNTSDAYELIEALYSSVNAEMLANDWAQSVINDEDGNRAAFAVSALISMREASNDFLESFKLAQAGGIIGRIKNKINKYITAEYTVEDAKLALIQTAFFDTDPADYKEVTSMYSVFCPVTVSAAADTTLFTLEDGNTAYVVNEYGLFAEEYCDYSQDFLKVAFLYEGENCLLTGTADGKVSAIMYVPTADGIEDYSFTEFGVAQGTEILLKPTDTTYFYADGVAITLNDDYVMPAENEVNFNSVVDAGKEVAKEEATSFIDKIKAFFQKISDFFKNLFK